MKQPDALRLFSAIYFLWGMWAAPFGSFVAIYLAGAGVSDQDIGFLFGAASLTALITALPSGVISDKLSTRRAMMIGLLLAAPFYFALTLTNSLLLLVLIFVVDSLGANLYGIASDSAMYRSIAKSKAASFGILHLVINLGNAVALLACGYIISLAGFSALGIIFMLFPLGIMFLVRRVPTVQAKFEKHTLSEYLREFSRREFLLFAVAIFLLSYHWGTEKTSFPLYASNILHISNESLGWYFSANLLFYGVAGFLAGRLVNVSKRRESLFAIGLLLSAAGSIFYAGSYDFTSSLLSRLLHDSGDAILGVSMMLVISGLVPKERLGGAVGAMTIVYVIAGFTGAVASGYINQHIGYSEAILVSAALTIASAAVLWLTLKLKISGSPFPTG